MFLLKDLRCECAQCTCHVVGLQSEDFQFCSGENTFWLLNTNVCKVLAGWGCANSEFKIIFLRGKKKPFESECMQGRAGKLKFWILRTFLYKYFTSTEIEIILTFERNTFKIALVVCTTAAAGIGSGNSETTTMELLATPWKLENAFSSWLWTMAI